MNKKEPEYNNEINKVNQLLSEIDDMHVEPPRLEMFENMIEEQEDKIRKKENRAFYLFILISIVTIMVLIKLYLSYSFTFVIMQGAAIIALIVVIINEYRSWLVREHG